ncbi:MAG TPA: hypothetical protein VKN36_12355, partial [Eudoraea sp.]|nr:hypothetical protein [Eudoraea sp.]
MHLIDTERGFSYRAIVCVRRDRKTPLYAMDENHYAANLDMSARNMEDMIEEFVAVRKALTLIFRNVPADNLKFEGNGVGHP